MREGEYRKERGGGDEREREMLGKERGRDGRGDRERKEVRKIRKRQRRGREEIKERSESNVRRILRIEG